MVSYLVGGTTITIYAFFDATTPDSVKELLENRLRILGFPTHLLLDRDGRVVSLPTTGSGSSDLLDALERTIRK